MRMRLMVFTAFITLLATLLTAMPAMAEVRLAYVDIQQALNECNAGKQAKAQFKIEVRSAEGKLKREEQQIQALKNQLQQKGMLMKPDERQNLADNLQSKMRDFRRRYQDYREDLAQKDNQMTGRIVSDLAQVVRQIAKRKGYTMVVEKGSILWGAPSINITSEVIRDYNAMHVKPGALSGTANSKTGFSSPSSFGAAAARRSTISK